MHTHVCFQGSLLPFSLQRYEEYYQTKLWVKLLLVGLFNEILESIRSMHGESMGVIGGAACP